MLSFKTHIKNFQIIRDGVLEFHPGLTVIRGPSNNGKTAILRAIEACVYNRSGDEFVTTGEFWSGVGISYNGHEVLWKKNKQMSQKNAYKVDGTVYTKLGRTALPEVTGALGMSEVEMLGGKERLNFWEQMEKPFLINKSEAQLFEFLSSSGEEQGLMKVLQTMRGDITTVTDEKKHLEWEMDVTRTRLAANELILQGMGGFEHLHSRIVKTNEEIKALGQAQYELDSISNLSRTLLASKYELDRINQYKGRIFSLYDTVALLQGEVTEISSGLTQIAALENRHTMDTRNYTLIKSDLTRLSGLEGLNEKFDRKSTLEADILSIREGLAAIQRADSLRVSNQAKHDLTKAELQLVEEELATFKSCPLCGSMLGEDGGHVNGGH